MRQSGKYNRRRRGVVNASSGLQRLYSTPVPSKRTGPLFNSFSYPTKISPEAIAVFIAAHTSPGATVLDAFAGSGTVGLAALLCDRPTDAMKQMAYSMKLKVQWGPRHAVLYEIGSLGAFVARTMCNPSNPPEFETVAKRFINRVAAEYEDLYVATDPDGNKGEIRHVIWSDVLSCPKCRQEVSYLDAVVNLKPIKIREDFQCPHCGTKSPVDFAKRVTEKIYDPLISQIVIRKKRVPVIVYGQTDGKNWRRRATADDTKRFKKILEKNVSSRAPIEPIVWGDLYRSGYHTGISHLHHFYTFRNFLAIDALWQAIDDEPLEFRDALRLLVLSYNAVHSTLMTRVVVKNGKRDFVLTGAQTGVLYVSSLPVEKNVFLGLRRKVVTISKAFSTVYGSRSQVMVNERSSTKINMPNESADYVFTDPPFGDFIPYAELNQINEIWLGRTTDRNQEIIISPAQGKSVERYGLLMRSVLSEIARVLRKSGKMTLVFHSSKAEIWQSLTEAYELAGFGIKATSILDKMQESFKQVVSTVSVKGDPVLLLEKRRSRSSVKDEGAERESIISSIVEKASREKGGTKENTPERMYSRFVASCLERGIAVGMDAETFYRIIPRKKYV